MAHTLEVVDEVEVKDVVRATRNTKVNVTPQKTMKIMNKKINNMRSVTFHIYSVIIVISTDTLFQNALDEPYSRNDFMNEEKYTPPKSESNTDEDDVWCFDNGASNYMTAERGWKIHHLDVKADFLNGDRKKLDSTLKEMGINS
nr:hypothetical protein [Tanacetum cinerariifolium]